MNMKKISHLLIGFILTVIILSGCSEQHLDSIATPSTTTLSENQTSTEIPIIMDSINETTPKASAEPTHTPALNNPIINDDNTTTWDTITFGNYYQTDDSVKEPIEWLVLKTNGNTALIVSKYNLDAKYYNSEDCEIAWKISTLRKWMNSTFYSTAFSPKERNAIINKKISNPRQEGGKTKDKLFLLAAEDVWNEDYGFVSDDSRQCQNTGYAEMQGAYSNEMGNGEWWLRSSYSEEECLDYIKITGEVDWNDYYIDTEKLGVRPAMYINLDTYWKSQNNSDENLTNNDDTREYILEDSHLKYLKDQDIEKLSKKELRLARNEIYARHGYIFKDKSLKKYFNSTDWYNGTIKANNFPDCLLNIYERENVSHIAAKENGKKYKATYSIQELKDEIIAPYLGEIQLDFFSKFCNHWSNGEKEINITPGEFNGKPYRLLKFEYNKNDYYNIRLELYNKSSIEFKEIITESAFVQDGFTMLTYDVNGHQTNDDGKFSAIN